MIILNACSCCARALVLPSCPGSSGVLAPQNAHKTPTSTLLLSFLLINTVINAQCRAEGAGCPAAPCPGPGPADLGSGQIIDRHRADRLSLHARKLLDPGVTSGEDGCGGMTSEFAGDTVYCGLSLGGYVAVHSDVTILVYHAGSWPFFDSIPACMA